MKVEIGGIIFDAIDNLSAHDMQAKMWEQREKHLAGKRVSIINTRVWYHAKQNLKYRKTINESNFTLADGYPIHRIMERKLDKKLFRLRGMDLMIATLEYNKNCKHLFLGTNSDTLSKLKANLEHRNLLSVKSSFLPLPYGEIDNIITKKLIEQISLENYDFIWISLGAPKQDYAAAILHDACPQSHIAGVGLVFDYLAGNVSQPPNVFVKFGLEWLYRIFTQTRRTKHFIKPFFVMLAYFILNIGTVVQK